MDLGVGRLGQKQLGGEPRDVQTGRHMWMLHARNSTTMKYPGHYVAFLVLGQLGYQQCSLQSGLEGASTLQRLPFLNFLTQVQLS